MINFIHISNFLSHENTTLKLHTGLNIIVGETDAGKSAIVKALNWVLTNRPLGDGYRSVWGGKTHVFMEVTSVMGHGNDVVHRLRSDTDNGYLVNTELGLKAFGSGVPDTIQKVLNMNDLNIQTQFQPHFLLSQNAAEVAKHFNQVAKLHKIDLGLANTNKWIFQVNQKIKAEQETISRLEQELKQYDNLDEIERELRLAEKWEQEKKELEQKYEHLTDLLLTLQFAQQDISRLSYLAALTVDFYSASNVFARLQKKTAYKANLDEWYWQWRYALEQVEKTKEILQAEKEVDECLELVEQYENAMTLKGKLIRYLSGYQEAEKQYEIFHAEIEDYTEQLGEVCPLCGQKIIN